MAILQYILEKLHQLTIDVIAIVSIFFIGSMGLILSTRDWVIDAKLIKATIRKHERDTNV